MFHNPLVSIIVPIYNGEKYIANCVDCLLAQTYSNIEILLINDGSKDNSLQIIKEEVKKHPDIKYIDKPNEGVSATRNLGIQQANGEYIYFFDVDDHVLPEMLAENVPQAVSNNADILYFNFWYCFVEENTKYEVKTQNSFSGNSLDFFNNSFLDLLKNEVFFAPWNKLYKRSFLIDNNLIFNKDLSIYEDILFNIMAASKASNFVVNNKPYYKYGIQSSGTALTRFHDNYYDSVEKIHKAAMSYCDKYDNNSDQKQFFNELFVNHIILHFRQICTRKDISPLLRIKLIKKITSREYFKKTLSCCTSKASYKLLFVLVKLHLNNLIFIEYSLI